MQCEKKWILHSQLHIPCTFIWQIWCRVYTQNNNFNTPSKRLYIISTLPSSLKLLSLNVHSALLWCIVPVCFRYTGRMSQLKWDFLFLCQAHGERGGGEREAERKWFSIWIAAHTVKLGDISHRRPQSIGESKHMPIILQSLCSKGQHQHGGNHWQSLKGQFLFLFSPNTHIFQKGVDGVSTDLYSDFIFPLIQSCCVSCCKKTLINTIYSE